MKQLLIDGVTYDAWTPKKEVEDLHPLVLEHIEHIFGTPSFYFAAKGNLISKGGIGSKPDGYVIAFGDSLQWHIVEIELSKHMEYEHIAWQLMKFNAAIEELKTRQSLIDELHDPIKQDEILRARFKNAVRKAKGDDVEIYKFLSELLKKAPIITVIIEEYTNTVREALAQVSSAQIEVVEFQTFTRADVGISVHAHLFEPVSKSTPKKTKEEGDQPKKSKLAETQLEFWNKFKEYAQNKKTKLRLRKTYPQHWYDISYGNSESHISLTVNTQSNTLGCGIYISDWKDLFKGLLKYKEEIEQELGERLEWMELPGKKASRIKLSRGGDIAETAKWEEYFDWFRKKAEDFQDVFLKYVKKVED